MRVNLTNLQTQKVRLENPEALLKSDYHNMGIKTSSVIDSITAIYVKDLKFYEKLTTTTCHRFHQMPLRVKN